MRLEIDTTVSVPPLAEKSDLHSRSDVDSAEVKSALNQGIKAAQAGNRAQARVSLLKATELDPRSESAWLWLASISEYPEELLGFLNHVLEINPENQRAIEWKTATHSLLSKTFVQRGIDASQENQKEFAAECFHTALEYDDRNAVAWMWMASQADSSSAKIPLLEKALAIEPENESAIAELEKARKDILKSRFTEAKAAAVAGNNAEAVNILDALLSVTPGSIEAWTMKSHLAEGFDEKIRCFESILAIDPDNIPAKAGRDSLLAIFGTVEAAHAESVKEAESFSSTEENGAKYPAVVDEPLIDKSPTQDLEMPADFSYEAKNSPEVLFELIPETENGNEELETVAEPFASLAEETTEPVEAASASNQLAEDVWDDGPFAAAIKDGPSEGDAVFGDPQGETIAFSYDAQPDLSVSNPSDESAEFEQWSPDAPSDPPIAMPLEELPAIEPSPSIGFETFVEASEVFIVKPESTDCPFCGTASEAQAISCQSCMAVLTLSDLELLLANQDADKVRLRQAVEEIERRRLRGEFESDELVTLGLGHLNLRNLQLGYECLAEASKLSPNNVVLAGQVNSLFIRLDEIKQQEEAHLKMPKGKSILVVDDSPTVRKLIAGKLEKCGHDVICANDGVEALEHLEHLVPDLILLDITMPRMDGYQVCKHIRSNDATKDVTVVMISGKDGFFDKVRGRMAGTTGYITKPFGPETLMKAVEMYLSGEVPELDEV